MRLPTLTTTDPATGQQRAKDATTLAQEIATQGNLGTQLSQVEKRWIDTVLQAHGSNPEIKAALAKMLDTLKPGQAVKLGATLAVRLTPGPDLSLMSVTRLPWRCPGRCWPGGCAAPPRSR